MLRISISDLETYRFWSANEDSTLDDLVRRLRHQEPPTLQMGAGRAFAKLMEHAEPGDFPGAVVDGWKFVFAIEDEFALPLVREVKAEEVWETPSGPVTVVGKADGLSGLVVHDQKLTERFDPEKYVDSLQWRAYLTLFGATKFVYDVFTAKYRGNTITIDSYDQFAFYAYPAMRSDVERAVNRLADVIVRYDIQRIPTSEARQLSLGGSR